MSDAGSPIGAPAPVARGGRAPAAPPGRASVAAGLVAGAAAFTLYVLTASRFVDRDDVAEFQTLSATGGIAHSGYPVPVMLLHLIGGLPVSTPAFRANLLSVLCGSLAVGFAAHAATRFGARAIPAVVAACALALGITPWEVSTHAEVYACSLAICAAGWLVATHYAARPGPRAAAGLGLLGGIGILSHYIMLALTPVVAMAAVAAARSRRLRASHLALAVAGFLIGLTPLLYMLAHDRPDQPMNYIHDTLRPDNAEELSGGHPPTTALGRAIWLLSARQYLTGNSYTPFSNLPKRILLLVTNWVLNEFPLWGTVLAGIGLWVIVRNRSPGWTYLVAWMAGILFWTFYGARWAAVRMFALGCLWAMTPGIAVALTGIARRSRPAAVAAGALLILLPFVRVSAARPPAPIAGAGVVQMVWDTAPHEWNPLASDPTWDAYGRAVMGALPARAVVLSCWTEGTTLRYFRYAEPLRTDVDILYHCQLPRPAYAAADSAARPIFTTYEPSIAMTGGRAFHEVGRWTRGGLWRIE